MPSAKEVGIMPQTLGKCIVLCKGTPHSRLAPPSVTHDLLEKKTM